MANKIMTKLRAMEAEAIEDTFRFCPRCATAAARLGQIPFKCEACGFCAFFGPVAAVGGLVVRSNGMLLLVRRAKDPGKGKWGLPGGFVDRGETVEQALAREIQEETDLQIISHQYLTTYPNQYIYRGVAAPVVDFFFVCSVDADDEVTIAADELEHFEWSHPAQQHLDNMAFDSNRRAIEKWLQQGSPIPFGAG